MEIREMHDAMGWRAGGEPDALDFQPFWFAPIGVGINKPGQAQQATENEMATFNFFQAHLVATIAFVFENMRRDSMLKQAEADLVSQKMNIINDSRCIEYSQAGHPERPKR